MALQKPRGNFMGLAILFFSSLMYILRSQFFYKVQFFARLIQSQI